MKRGGPFESMVQSAKNSKGIGTFVDLICSEGRLGWEDGAQVLVPSKVEAPRGGGADQRRGHPLVECPDALHPINGPVRPIPNPAEVLPPI